MAYILHSLRNLESSLNTARLSNAFIRMFPDITRFFTIAHASEVLNIAMHLVLGSLNAFKLSTRSASFEIHKGKLAWPSYLHHKLGFPLSI